MTWRPLFFLGLALLLTPSLLAGEPPPLAPAVCRALRDRIGEHARVSEAARRALGLTAAPAPSPPQDPAARARAVKRRLGQIREERTRLEDEQVGALLKLEFGRVAQIKDRIEALDRERRGLEDELATLQAGGPVAGAPPAGADLGRVPCRELPALEARALKARRKELGGADWQTALVPLLPVRGPAGRDVGAELSAQLGAGPEARHRLGLLDQDGNARVDGFVDSPPPGVYRLYRQRSDGSIALDLFHPASQPADVAGEAARRIEEALLRQTRRGLADLLPLRPVGATKLLGETADFARLQALVDSGELDPVIQARALGARSVEFQNYRGEIVRVLEVIAGATGAVERRTASTLGRQDGTEEREETVTRFRPVSFWRVEVEVEASREVRPPAAGAAASRTVAPTVRFTLDR